MPVEYTFTDSNADTIQEMGDVIEKPRKRKKRDEAYEPNYTVLEDLIPTGVLAQAKSMVGTQSRGSKTALRAFQSAEFHKRMAEQYKRMVAFHEDHNEKIAKKLGELTGDVVRIPQGLAAVTAFLESLQDDVLNHMAASRGMSTLLPRDEIIAQLAQTWHTPPASDSPA